MPRHASVLPLAYLKSNVLKMIPNFAPSKANSPLNYVRVGFHASDFQAKIFCWFYLYFFLVAAEVRFLKPSPSEVML